MQCEEWRTDGFSLPITSIVVHYFRQFKFAQQGEGWVVLRRIRVVETTTDNVMMSWVDSNLHVFFFLWWPKTEVWPPPSVVNLATETVISLQRSFPNPNPVVPMPQLWNTRLWQKRTSIVATGSGLSIQVCGWSSSVKAQIKTNARERLGGEIL